MHSKDYEEITRRVCNDACTKFRKHTCDVLPGNKYSCYLWQVERAEYEKEGHHENQVIRIPETGYVVILFDGEDVRGHYHSVQRAKRDAKVLGLNNRMRIVEYQIVAATGNRCNLIAKYVHEWGGKWASCIAI